MEPSTFMPWDFSRPSPADTAVKMMTMSRGPGRGMLLRYLLQPDDKSITQTHAGKPYYALEDICSKRDTNARHGKNCSNRDSTSC